MSDGKAATRPVAIIGGGFSGSMTAVQLASRGIPSLLIDGSGRLGRGVAYSTRELVHLLNVSTDKMSAWPERPRDFADWCGDSGTGFAERRAFGRYLGEQLAGAAGITPIEAMATSAERLPTGWRVTLADGRALEASSLVLAVGNQPPAPFPGSAQLPPSLFVNNPWSEEAQAAVASAAVNDADVLILGTGLTMVDTVLSLAAAGHDGKITALSRRGLLPRGHVHPPATPAPVALNDVPLGSVTALWRWLRRRSANVGFRAAVDALRPHSQAIWQHLPSEERRRFMRHAQPWWGAHRHRIAPQVAEQLRDLIASGRLEILAGRVRSMAPSQEGLSITIARRGGRERALNAAVAFNCTGPLGDIRRTVDPLLKSLFTAAEIRPDPMGLGIQVDRHSRAGDRLWALGPLTKGMYWEIIAVPDIRHQAEGVAAAIAKELTDHG